MSLSMQQRLTETPLLQQLYLTASNNAPTANLEHQTSVEGVMLQMRRSSQWFQSCEMESLDLMQS